jgi:nucleoside-diphosphate-sugar epimerase
MRVLLTGATGFIGGAVAEAVAYAGHHLRALAHDARVAAEVSRRGWTPVAGDLRDAAGLAEAAGQVDAVIHAAMVTGEDAAAVDTIAARELLRGLKRGGGGVFVYTSGAWVLGSGRSHEASPLNPVDLVAWRAAVEAEVRAAGPEVRGVVVRPGIAYGRGAGIPGMLARGDLPLIAPGTQQWPLVHVDDLAQLYVLALTAPAASVLHGVSVTRSMKELAVAAGTDAAEAIGAEEARSRFGTLADALLLDQEVASEATRALVGWRPGALDPVDEIAAGSYAAVLAETALAGRGA